MKILFIDTAHNHLQDMLTQSGFTCHYYPTWTRDDYLKNISNYNGVIIRSKIKIDKEILDIAKELKFIARVGAGMENIDVAYAEKLGIACLNAPEGNRNAVAEHALGMLLAINNKLCKVNSEVKSGVWEREKNRGCEIEGKTIAIIGYGNTGSAFAQILSGFAATILAYDKYKSGFSNSFVKESTLYNIFQEADIVSLHIPLKDETFHFADINFFKNFRKKITVINTSRGKCLDTEALLWAIENNIVSAACLDVLEYENLSFENLKNSELHTTYKRLIELENVILSPHIAGWTIESNYKLAKFLYEKILKLTQIAH